MYKLAFSLIAALTLMGASAAQPVFKLSCDKGKTPQACLNQTVLLEARIAQGNGPENDIMQHPIMTTPFDKPELIQSYTQISSNLGQVVLLSAEAINCPKVALKGQLSKYELECSSGEGGKCEYSNYVLRVSSFKCLK